MLPDIFQYRRAGRSWTLFHLGGLQIAPPHSVPFTLQQHVTRMRPYQVFSTTFFFRKDVSFTASRTSLGLHLLAAVGAGWRAQFSQMAPLSLALSRQYCCHVVTRMASEPFPAPVAHLRRGTYGRLEVPKEFVANTVDHIPAFRQEPASLERTSLPGPARRGLSTPKGGIPQTGLLCPRRRPH